jgi:hypothetical protein
MDPYLEAFDIWPGFHNKLESELITELNAALPAPYYAALEVRQELGVIEDRVTTTRIIPDLTVLRYPGPSVESTSGGVGVLEGRRVGVSPSFEVIINLDLIDHAYVEIRDPSRGHKLITLIEILNPSNKRSGADRRAYRAKQSEVLKSDANLIELDLLRGGRRIFADLNLQALIASRRLAGTIAYEAYPISVREWLPCIPVPLKEGEADLPLDLQFVFNRAYDGGPYRRGAVDYAGAVPEPGLSDEDRAWAAELTLPWRQVSLG